MWCPWHGPAGHERRDERDLPGGGDRHLLRRGEHDSSRRGAGRPWLLRLFLLASSILALTWDAGSLVRRARRGPWRVEVAGESMAPGLHHGDWLLVDPTPARWPRRGTLVVVREPDTYLVVVKRVAARPGDRIRRSGEPPTPLGATEAWLASDAPDGAIDSRRYGPVDLERLLGRVAWRYGPPGRAGRVR
jgi:signal peptidase I